MNHWKVDAKRKFGQLLAAMVVLAAQSALGVQAVPEQCAAFQTIHQAIRVKLQKHPEPQNRATTGADDIYFQRVELFAPDIGRVGSGLSKCLKATAGRVATEELLHIAAAWALVAKYDQAHMIAELSFDHLDKLYPELKAALSRLVDQKAITAEQSDDVLLSMAVIMGEMAEGQDPHYPPLDSGHTQRKQ